MRLYRIKVYHREHCIVDGSVFTVFSIFMNGVCVEGNCLMSPLMDFGTKLDTILIIGAPFIVPCAVNRQFYVLVVGAESISTG
jgi:hypothetical protein